jgi:DNA-binding response OmpR family regulator
MTCRRIKRVRGVPIVLMVGQERADWKKVQSLDVDGYIPQEVNGSELVARLKAVSRRFRSANDLKNEPRARAPF